MGFVSLHFTTKPPIQLKNPPSGELIRRLGAFGQRRPLGTSSPPGSISFQALSKRGRLGLELSESNPQLGGWR